MRVIPSSSTAEEEEEEGRCNGGDGDAAPRSLSHLYLNVYDLTSINNYIYWFGLGIFHSGIEVHDMEYGFGAHDYPTSGVFEVEPKSCPGFIYRRSVWLGTTEMSQSEFRSFMEHLAGEYHGDSYHLISKNCNHFTDDVCFRLTGKHIPGWVNRLARIASGSLCNCLLPESIHLTSVGHMPEHLEFSDGSESPDSSYLVVSDDEEQDLRLLKSPSLDRSSPRDKQLKLAKDMMA